MEEKKRYVATIQLYVYAECDEQATLEARKLAYSLDTAHDNKAAVIELVEQEFGKLTHKKIKL